MTTVEMPVSCSQSREDGVQKIPFVTDAPRPLTTTNFAYARTIAKMQHGLPGIVGVSHTEAYDPFLRRP